MHKHKWSYVLVEGWCVVFVAVVLCLFPFPPQVGVVFVFGLVLFAEFAWVFLCMSGCSAVFAHHLFPSLLFLLPLCPPLLFPLSNFFSPSLSSFPPFLLLLYSHCRHDAKSHLICCGTGSYIQNGQGRSCHLEEELLRQAQVLP